MMCSPRARTSTTVSAAASATPSSWSLMTGGETIDGNYEVYLLGQWRRIEPWKITINQVNPTGKAIVWYDADPEEEAEEADAVVRVIIFCFKPLDTY